MCFFVPELLLPNPERILEKQRETLITQRNSNSDQRPRKSKAPRTGRAEMCCPQGVGTFPARKVFQEKSPCDQEMLASGFSSRRVLGDCDSLFDFFQPLPPLPRQETTIKIVPGNHFASFWKILHLRKSRQKDLVQGLIRKTHVLNNYVGACAMTTTFIENKLCNFNILLLWRKKKTTFLDDFPKTQNASSVVSLSLTM